MTSSGAGWRSARRIEARLWTGPAGHLVGGAADLAEALARYALARAGRRSGVGSRPRGGRRGHAPSARSVSARAPHAR